MPRPRKQKTMPETSPHATDTHVRIALIEGELGGMRQSLAELSKAVMGIRDDLSARPKSVPYREIAGAVAATLTVLAIISGYAQWWVNGATEHVRSDVARLERTINAGEMAVLIYRVSELEKRVKSQ